MTEKKHFLTSDLMSDKP